MKINAFNVTTAKELAARTKQAQTKVANGVYIQDTYGKLWKVNDWDNRVKPNAIAVITPKHNFRIAMADLPSKMCINSHDNDLWGERIEGCYTFDSDKAKLDYRGAENTRQIMALQPSTDYGAGRCAAYTFPDGVTKGYLPAAGELHLTYKNREAIDEALEKCGGEALGFGYYLSSTLGEPNSSGRKCWYLRVRSGNALIVGLDNCGPVRPFAPLEI